MINILHTISSKIKSSKRKIKAVMGDTFATESYQSTPWGYDSVPLKNAAAVQLPSNRDIIVGYIQRALDELSPGESVIFSKDQQNGELKAKIVCKNDGTIELNGNSDNLVRYSELDSSIGDIVSDINRELTSIAVAIAGLGGAYTKIPVQYDISGAKIDDLKTN
jgi:hypothetical protein